MFKIKKNIKLKELNETAEVRFRNVKQQLKHQNNGETPNWYKINDDIFKEMIDLVIHT